MSTAISHHVFREGLKWKVQIPDDSGNLMNLGSFDDEKTALEKYQKARQKLSLDSTPIPKPSTTANIQTQISSSSKPPPVQHIPSTTTTTTSSAQTTAPNNNNNNIPTQQPANTSLINTTVAPPSSVIHAPSNIMQPPTTTPSVLPTTTIPPRSNSIAQQVTTTTSTAQPAPENVPKMVTQEQGQSITATTTTTTAPTIVTPATTTPNTVTPSQEQPKLATTTTTTTAPKTVTSSQEQPTTTIAPKSVTSLQEQPKSSTTTSTTTTTTATSTTSSIVSENKKRTWNDMNNNNNNLSTSPTCSCGSDVCKLSPTERQTLWEHTLQCRRSNACEFPLCPILNRCGTDDSAEAFAKLERDVHPPKPIPRILPRSILSQRSTSSTFSKDVIQVDSEFFGREHITENSTILVTGLFYPEMNKMIGKWCDISSPNSYFNFTLECSSSSIENLPCKICQSLAGQENDFIICDLCDDAFHLLCINLSKLPNEDEDYFCPTCSELRKSTGYEYLPPTRKWTGTFEFMDKKQKKQFVNDFVEFRFDYSRKNEFILATVSGIGNNSFGKYTVKGVLKHRSRNSTNFPIQFSKTFFV